jgi:transketolase
MASEWECLLKRYCTAFRDKEPELVADIEQRTQGKYMTDKWRAAVNEYLCTEQAAIDKGVGILHNGSNGHASHIEEPDAKRQKISTEKFKYKAGRVYATEVLKTMVEMNPSIIGGSADVASSSGGHFPKIQGHFLPPCERYKDIEGANYGSRYIHFGVREHGMCAILNGISSYAGLVPYCSMFTVFYQYALPAIRMAAISKFPVLYIGTHDSIDLGEDGPTHQPVEVLPQLRAMPNLLVIRPASVDEMVGAFRVFEEQYTQKRSINEYIDPKPLKRRPVFIMTSRGELGLPYKSNTDVRGDDGLSRGAYVVHDCFDRKANIMASPRKLGGLSKQPSGEDLAAMDPLPDIVLIGSGQDVALVMKAKEILLDWSNKFNEQLKTAFANFPCPAIIPTPKKIKIRIVSMPCWELFDEQDEEYQDSVLLSNYDDILRIYVEKAATKNTGHDKYAHFSVLMSGFGLSGKAADVERKLEFTPDYVAAKVWAEWVDRGRRLQRKGDTADEGEVTWVSRLRHRMGSH